MHIFISERLSTNWHIIILGSIQIIPKNTTQNIFGFIFISISVQEMPFCSRK